MDLRRLTESELDSVVVFARCLDPVPARIELVRDKHRADDVGEVERHLRLLVRDTAKNLRTTNGRRLAEKELVGEVEVKGPPSKCFIPPPIPNLLSSR